MAPILLRKQLLASDHYKRMAGISTLFFENQQSTQRFQLTSFHLRFSGRAHLSVSLLLSPRAMLKPSDGEQFLLNACDYLWLHHPKILKTAQEMQRSIVICGPGINPAFLGESLRNSDNLDGVEPQYVDLPEKKRPPKFFDVTTVVLPKDGSLVTASSTLQQHYAESIKKANQLNRLSKFAAPTVFGSTLLLTALLAGLSVISPGVAAVGLLLSVAAFFVTDYICERLQKQRTEVNHQARKGLDALQPSDRIQHLLSADISQTARAVVQRRKPLPIRPTGSSARPRPTKDPFANHTIR